MIKPLTTSTASSPRTADPQGSGSSDEPPQRSSAAAGYSPITLEQDADVGQRIDLPWLRNAFTQAAALAAQAANRPLGSISARIIDDHRIAQLHSQHFGISHTTDVISFDLAEKSDDPIQADLVVNADEASRRAGELGHLIERELLLYCLHGLLHCAGYDDKTDAGAAAMHAQEDRILQAIGVGPTFAPPSRARPPRARTPQPAQPTPSTITHPPSPPNLDAAGGGA